LRRDYLNKITITSKMKMGTKSNYKI
jgi:hypothetical protein